MNLCYSKRSIKKISKIFNSILDLLRWASTQFNASHICYGHGTDNFWDEALHLILPTLHLPIESPQQIYNAYLTLNEKQYVIQQIIKRVKKRIPVPYLTNKAWFCGLEFYVDERVFIPRSPFGEIIQSHLSNLLQKKPHYILDICTGSGCIAIATALKFSNSQIDAVDISNEALKVTEYNIKLHELEDRVVPIQSDLFQKIPKLKYDLILANPPYVNEKEMKNLPKEFLFEPKIAICAGYNKLKIILDILYNASNYLKSTGTLICEAGNAQKQLRKIYSHIPFHWIHCHNGGEGVFMLTYDQLIKNKKIFKNFKKND